MLEFAVSLVGVVSLMVISLNVWQWLGRMVVERQDSFQQTRKEAGSTKPGERVPYHRPPIQLFKSPASLGGDGAPGEIPVPPDATDCPAGHALYDEATALKAQSDAETRLAEKASKKIYDPDHPQAGFKYQLDQCDSDDDDCIKYWSNIIQDTANNARHHAKNAEDLNTQASQKFEEGDALCNPPDSPPSTN